MKILFFLLSLFTLVGCAQIIKWDQQAYDQSKAYADQTMRTWSLNSGFYTCALAQSKIVFPTTVKNYDELSAIVNNSTVAMGIPQLDDIARRLGYWSDTDFDLGCSLGVRTRMTVSEIIAIIKVAYPAAGPYLPSFGGAGVLP